MLWPNILTIIFRNSHTGLPLQGILISIVVVAKTKNDYSLHPILTNSNGAVMLAREIIEGEIDAIQNNAIMDYSSQLSDCGGFEVQIETIKSLKDRVRRIKGFYPDNAENLKAMINVSKNGTIQSDVKKRINLVSGQSVYQVEV